MFLAFYGSSYDAYEQLRKRSLKEGKTVNVYLADLRCLTALIGQNDADPIIKCAFMAGMPSDISTQLKSIAAVGDLSLSELVGIAQMMLLTRAVDMLTCAVRQT